MNYLEGRSLAKKIIENTDVKGAFVCIIKVGKDSSSESYSKAIIKNFEKSGVKYAMYNLEETIKREDFIKLISTFDKTDYITGVFLFKPLPSHLKDIISEKDLDNPPCTPAAVMHILNEYNIKLESKNCLIIGRSDVVGKPLANLLLAENATVTIAHSYTKNLIDLTKKAEIIICAVGRTGFLKKEMISENTVIIDVGINFENGKLIGDCDFDSLKEITEYITPVPGGVGPVTNSMLILNLAKKIENNRA